MAKEREKQHDAHVWGDLLLFPGRPSVQVLSTGITYSTFIVYNLRSALGFIMFVFSLNVSVSDFHLY